MIETISSLRSSSPSVYLRSSRSRSSRSSIGQSWSTGMTVCPRRCSCSRTRCAPSSVGTRIDARPSPGSALRSISPDLTSADTWREIVEGSAHRYSARSLARLGPMCASLTSRNSGDGSPSGPDVTLDLMPAYRRTSWTITDPISPACASSLSCSGEVGESDGGVSSCCCGCGCAMAGVSRVDAPASVIDVVAAEARIMDSPPYLLGCAGLECDRLECDGLECEGRRGEDVPAEVVDCVMHLVAVRKHAPLIALWQGPGCGGLGHHRADQLGQRGSNRQLLSHASHNPQVCPRERRFRALGAGFEAVSAPVAAFSAPGSRTRRRFQGLGAGTRWRPDLKSGAESTLRAAADPGVCDPAAASAATQPIT